MAKLDHAVYICGGCLMTVTKDYKVVDPARAPNAKEGELYPEFCLDGKSMHSLSTIWYVKFYLYFSFSFVSILLNNKINITFSLRFPCFSRFSLFFFVFFAFLLFGEYWTDIYWDVFGIWCL